MAAGLGRGECLGASAYGKFVTLFSYAGINDRSMHQLLLLQTAELEFWDEMPC